MSRKTVVGGNWKSNPGSLIAVKELCAAFAGFKDKLNGKIEIVICPTAVHGDTVIEMLKGTGMEVGIQNISKTGNGAFTGEVTAEMAKEVGYTWCLIGHSERRTRYGETDADTIAKLQSAQAAGLKIMFCIGETLEEREGGQTNAVNQRQLKDALPVVTDWDNFVIAYEPVWAIGTGKVATPDMAEETQAAIRAYITEVKGAEIANQVRIQYGGSASPDNCEGLIAKPNIDGFLVGGASLKPSFTTMFEKLQA